MLNKSFIIQHDAQGHCVRFKYMSVEDFRSYYEVYREVHQGRIPEEDFYEKHKLSTLNSVAGRTHLITDLEREENALRVSYQAFLRARDAACLSSDAFQWAMQRRALTPNTLLDDILEKHFKNARKMHHLNTIQTTFAKTARELKSNCTISDNLGREVDAWGAPVEGIIMFKRDVYNRKRTEQKRLIRRPREAQRIMRKYLETGETKSIAIQFSNAKVKPVDWVARYILHEGTHKFAATGDWGYLHHRGGIDHLRPAAAVVNADSFAFAGMSILRREFTTPRDLERGPVTPFQNQNYFDERENYIEYLKYGGD